MSLIELIKMTNPVIEVPQARMEDFEVTDFCNKNEKQYSVYKKTDKQYFILNLPTGIISKVSLRATEVRCEHSFVIEANEAIVLRVRDFKAVAQLREQARAIVKLITNRE